MICYIADGFLTIPPQTIHLRSFKTCLDNLEYSGRKSNGAVATKRS